MVRKDEYHPVSKQGRHLQAKARPLPPRELFPRLLRRQRRQQGRKIPALAIQPSQQSTSQSLPTVRIDRSVLVKKDCTVTDTVAV